MPGHSTGRRTRQLFPAAVFARLFDHVVAQCVARGLVAGATQAVDAAPVKANASLESAKPPTGTRDPFLTTGEAVAPAPTGTAPAPQLRRPASQAPNRARNPGRAARESPPAQPQDA